VDGNTVRKAKQKRARGVKWKHDFMPGQLVKVQYRRKVTVCARAHRPGVLSSQRVLFQVNPTVGWRIIALVVEDQIEATWRPVVSAFVRNESDHK
jgi:hypothetical protein